MGLFGNKNKKGFATVESMKSGDREEEIARRERERLRICEEIEQVLKNYAKESGNRRLARRRYKIGKGPNDYGYGMKR